MVVVTTCVIIDKDLIQGHQCDVKMPVALMNKKNNSAYDKTLTTCFLDVDERG